MVSSPGGSRRARRVRSVIAGPGPVRLVLGFAAGATFLVALTTFLVHHRSGISVATALALYLLVVVLVTAIGGALPGIIASVAAPLLANWYLIPPYHTFRVNDGDNLIELSVFVSTATIVAAYVSIAERRAAEAAAARMEADRLAIEQARLRRIALEVEVLAKADELRTAILRAVSHDLRTPLAGIKASVSSLRQGDVQWGDDQREEFLESIETDTDRLTHIVTNLLDLSRIEAGVVRPVVAPVALVDVVATALRSMPDHGRSISVDVAPDVPEMLADHALLERVLVNLVQNALKWSTADAVVEVQGRKNGSHVQILVVDRGPGIPAEKRQAVLQPFHRSGDAGSTGGLGLGLAIADRLVAAMGGKFNLGETTGGGLTAEVLLPCAEEVEEVTV